jgi:hypothetical protein
MQREEILRILKTELSLAEHRRDAAAAFFREIIGNIPSGIPHPDGVERIRAASHDYRRALNEAATASARLNEFLAQGTIPPDISH